MASLLETVDFGYQNFYQASLSADATDTDTDIFLDIVPTVSEGTLIIDPNSETNREIIYFSSKTGTKVVCPANGRGYDGSTAVAHTTGTTVIMAPIADWFYSLRELFTTTPGGWTAVASTLSVASGYNKTNKSYELDSSADLTGILTPGMRFKVGTSGVTLPTQSTDLEASSSQYWSKSSPSGITFTDDFTCEAWIKLESYGDYKIVARFSTTGWLFGVDSNGRPIIQGFSAAGTQDYFTASQTVPLNRWVHVAASLDLSGSSGKVYIDGVEVSGTYTNSAATAIVQAGNLQVGASNATSHFDGKIADVRVWSAVRTATEIQDNMSKVLTGSETNLVAHFPMNGNGNDSTANANNLTGQAGAVATSADNPYNQNSGTNYGIITKVTSTKLTVFTGTDSVITNATLASPEYSNARAPFGFPAGRSRWEIVSLLYSGQTSSAASGTYVNPGSYNITLPIGEWDLRASLSPQQTNSSAALYSPRTALSTSTTDVTDYDLIATIVERTSSTSASYSNVYLSKNLSITTPTPYYAIITSEAGGGTISVGFAGDSTVDDEVTNHIKAVCAYL